MIRSKYRSVLFLGPFPPPIHGLSRMNELVASWLESESIDITRVDTGGETPRGGLAILRRLGTSFSIFFRLVKFGFYSKKKIIYMTISGGRGQALEAFYSLVIRIFGFRTIVHHHSFQYINKPNTLSKLLINFIGGNALHVSLCECMTEKITNEYGVNNIITVTNAAFSEPEKSEYRIQVKPNKYTIGFISNISVAKGIQEFFDIVRPLFAQPGIAVLIAGPYADLESQKIVERELALHPEKVSYIGAAYGEDKSNFWALTDLLLFPSSYINEADPLVIHESLSNGVAVISTYRGCIPDLIKRHHCLTITQDQQGHSLARQHILSMYSKDFNERIEAREQIQLEYNYFRQAHLHAREKIILYIEECSGVDNERDSSQ